MKFADRYYEYIVDLVVDKYKDEFERAQKGHCIKITGLASEQVHSLLKRIRSDFKNLDSFILSDTNTDQALYVSSSRLINFRNKEERPLIVLIPANSRTAAEDSYGNSTFKDINLERADDELANKLLKAAPQATRALIEEVYNYLGGVNLTDWIDFLLAIDSSNWSREAVGDCLYLLGMIPDSLFGVEESKNRARLNFNSLSSEKLSDFNRSIFERLKELPLEKNTIQQQVVSFLKSANDLRNRKALVQLIADEYPDLNFSTWSIPDLNVKTVRLTVESLKSNEFKTIDGTKCLITSSGKAVKLKARVVTIPEVKTIQELAFFRVILMASNGLSGEFVQELKKIKNTNSKLAYKDLTVAIDPNLISEGSYFLKVLAEDENGVVLNSDDKFKDEAIERHWQELKAHDVGALKSSIERKLSSDSEDFYFTITEEDNIERESIRKDKLSNVFQAYFKFRIDLLKNGQEPTEPLPEDGTAQWIGQPSASTKATYHIRYNSKHDYQINLSSKLYHIERTFLKHASQLGQVKVTASNNPTQTELNSLKFSVSDLLTRLVPTTLLNARTELFTAISKSTPANDGVLFTTNLNDFYNLAITYIEELNKWTTEIREKFKNLQATNSDEAKELYELLLEMQAIDIVSLQTRLDDNRPLEVKLLAPMHPLRIAWTINLIDLFNGWEVKTINNTRYRKDWVNNLDNLFLGELTPGNNPLVIIDDVSKLPFQYSGELTYGWGLYIKSDESASISNTLISVNRQIKTFLARILNIEKENRIENEVSERLIVKHISNYLIQHPYTDCLVVNLFNSGDATAFANALVDMEQTPEYRKLRYEVRLFRGEESVIEQGEGLRNLLNPEYNITAEAEAFSQPSFNRLFPKLRFSINHISEFLNSPGSFGAHISFVISPFPLKTELYKCSSRQISFFMDGTIVNPAVEVSENGSEIQWNKFIYPNKSGAARFDVATSIFENLQVFIAGALATKYTDALPATSLLLKEADKVLINNIHDYSDWVVTFDKNLGPEIFDLPSREGEIPFLLDYVPGEEVTGISSYLTTRPTSEIVGLLGPHFQEFDISLDEANPTARMLLEDLRSVSSSLIMQLNSGKNKAFEVVGAAFTKRVLEKKQILANSFLIPIDLHQDLFNKVGSESKSRADHLLVRIDVERRIIEITVIEVKCRRSLSDAEALELKAKMKEQIENTILALKTHFDPDNSTVADRLDRAIKNMELKSLLEFYIKRANRYGHLTFNTFQHYLDFISTLDSGFSISFRELGLVFDFSAPQRHKKEEQSSTLTYFTFGASLIREILDPDSDLNTQRLEKVASDEEFVTYFTDSKELSPFIQGNFLRKDAQEDQKKYPSGDFGVQIVSEPSAENTDMPIAADTEEINELHKQFPPPQYDILIGKTSDSEQYGIIGKTIQGKIVALDCNETNTISLFGIQGGGKSYTIGTITEMMLKKFGNINHLQSPLAGVIFHYSDTMDYSPEAVSMVLANDKQSELDLLKAKYGAVPDKLDDVVLLSPADKTSERKSEFPSISVQKIAFNSKELNVQDWMFLLGAIGNDATYVRQIKAIMREIRNNITIAELRSRIDSSPLLTNSQRALAKQRLNFAAHYIDDSYWLREFLKPGRLLIIDLRDEFIEKDEALGLFVMMLNIFSGVREISGQSFNKFIVFDEAHKYMDNVDLTGTIVAAIREMRHKGVSIMIASQDPPSLPNAIIELSTVLIMHKFNSPQWLKHIQKSITQVSEINAGDLASLSPGEAFIWATRSTDKLIMSRPIKIFTRPRVTKHGGATIEAIK